MDIHDEVSAKVGVDRDGKARPGPYSWIIPAIISLIVLLLFLGSLNKVVDAEPVARTQLQSLEDLPQVAREIRDDLVLVLESQLKTFATIALFAFFPGLFGLIYRNKFWHWFLIAFGILFAINLVGYVSKAGSLSMEMLAGLHYDYWTFVAVEAVLLALLLVFRLRRHVTVPKGEERRPKNIVVCLDGTWNHPGQTDWGHLAQTNVFKLFDALEVTKDARQSHFNAARCKRYFEGDQEKQVGFYYNGVGNKVENSVLGEKIGGAFGLGAEAIKERAYLDVAREYQPGDRIFIFGFSRGAALARLVAGALDKRGVPKSVWTLRIFGRQRPVKTSKEHIGVEIEVLGCWDTVAAFGISKDILGIPFQRVNLLKDLTVPLCVKRAYHLVAMDEDRDAFEPTLMDPDPTNPSRIIEVWFSGNHSNVGGGFATDGLSDHTLSFMLARLTSAWDPVTKSTTDDKSWGLYLKPGQTFRPNPLGKLRRSGGAIYQRRPREVPVGGMIHDSVFERIRDDQSSYIPDSLFACNQAIHKLRTKVNGEVEILKATRSLTDEEAGEVDAWVDRQLTLGKWSKKRMLTPIDPPGELVNA